MDTGKKSVAVDESPRHQSHQPQGAKSNSSKYSLPYFSFYLTNKWPFPGKKLRHLQPPVRMSTSASFGNSWMREIWP